MPLAEYVPECQGYGLTTVQIHYYMPDHPSLLQLFTLQQFDIAPRFPRLHQFLDHWRREIEAALHSIEVAHRDLTRPGEWRAAKVVIPIH